MVAAAGITDPGIAQAAELDYIATGDPSYRRGGRERAADRLRDDTRDGYAVRAAAGGRRRSRDLEQRDRGERRHDAGRVRRLHLTTTATTATPIDYTLYAPDGTYLAAAAFGGAPPSDR